MAEALYRKYRPQIFEDVVGQEHIERTIKNAIAQDKVSHAYLFTGPRGTGKTTTARLLAKALLCQKGPTAEPDGTCEDCQAIANGEHPDVYELDAASRTGVENVREEIIGRVQFAPTRGRYKIYIIDEVHMLSTAAFNALLKTLEEPPSHVVFILATTDPQKVPETIHSRCQRFDFRRISTDSIVSRLGAICVAEDVEFEGEALELVAHRAEGGMRNALTSLEQLIAFGGGKVSLEVAERMLGSLASSDLAEIVRFVGTRDVASCFRWTAEFVETGADFSQFTRDFAEHVRNMYVMSLAGVDVALDVSEAGRRELAEELKMFGPDRLARLLGVLGDLSAELKTSTNPRLSFEIALTRMVRPESDLTLEGLAERIERLEQGGISFANAASAVPASVGAPASHDFAPERLEKVSAGVQREPQGQQAQAQQAQWGQRAQAQQVQPQVSQADPAQREAAPLASGMGAAVAEPSASMGAAAAAATASAAGELSAAALANLNNPAALQRTWQQVLGSLKKVKAAYGVLFLNTKALFEEESATFVIEFPAENDFAFKAVQKPDIIDELKNSLAQVCGAPVNFRFTKAGGGAASAGFTQAAAAQPQRAQVQQAEAAARVAAQVQQPVRAQQTQQPAQPAAQVQAQAQPAVQQAARAQQSMQQVQQPVRAQQAQQPARQQAQPAASSAAHYDEVPVDIYDDYVPYDDEAWEPVADPWAQAQAQAQPAQQVPARREPATSQAASASPSPAAHEGVARSTALTAATSAASDLAAAAAEPSLDDLDAMLAFGFGDGVTFEEV